METGKVITFLKQTWNRMKLNQSKNFKIELLRFKKRKKKKQHIGEIEWTQLEAN